MDKASAFERFVALAKRELQADDVRLLAPEQSPPAAPNIVVVRLPDARHVVATFARPPIDADVVMRRMTMLASMFVDTLEDAPLVRSRPPITSALHEELKALATRARANDVVVMDIDSPVIWACASVHARPHLESEFVPDHPALIQHTLRAIRGLPELHQLHKGRPFRRAEAEGPYYLVLSFSGIYLLCLVFEAPFDELRAERAAHESLVRIERLVLALPPLDPEPMGGVIAFRKRRR